ncbi:GcrA family cell cycle regulator [Bradyrhizobium lablabi]|uniref:GcrA family cell cycle regulator n=1 Tax=Bradyrhizobium lablabi TaxID=722472 RepID=UPI001BA469D1|nr:GcrA family cell cycle regulator [Bradyrhizobium lablabi]MBR0695804.1 GcrA-like regulator [Bradyrhizobium lablabi]
MIAIQPTWTPERVEQLKSYFEAGLSCRDIAFSIGVSRNAVIGKLSRLNLTRGTAGAERRPRKRSGEHPRKQTAKQQLLMLRSAYGDPQEEDAPVVSANSCSLLELSEQRCRWPISTPGADDFCFCGNTPLGGLPYCLGHYRLAYQFGPRQRTARG